MEKTSSCFNCNNFLDCQECQENFNQESSYVFSDENGEIDRFRTKGGILESDNILDSKTKYKHFLFINN